MSVIFVDQNPADGVELAKPTIQELKRDLASDVIPVVILEVLHRQSDEVMWVQYVPSLANRPGEAHFDAESANVPLPVDVDRRRDHAAIGLALPEEEAL